MGTTTVCQWVSALRMAGWYRRHWQLVPISSSPQLLTVVFRSRQTTSTRAAHAAGTAEDAAPPAEDPGTMLSSSSGAMTAAIQPSISATEPALSVRDCGGRRRGGGGIKQTTCSWKRNSLDTCLRVPARDKGGSWHRFKHQPAHPCTHALMVNSNDVAASSLLEQK